MIAIAQAYANAGYAVVAADHSLHGLAVGHPLRAFNTAVPGLTIHEQTFDADVSNNTTGAAGADGVTDTSGQNYINLSQLLTFRGNVMKSTVNHIQLIKSLGNLSYDGVAGGDFDTSRMHFTSMSLGAITGTVTLGVNTNVQAATLSVPGGPWIDIARNSATFFYSEEAALDAIDFNTLGLLQGMMTLVAMLEPTGFFQYLAVLAARASKGKPVRLFILLGAITTILSMFLDNVTTVVLIAPVTLLICEIIGINALPFLMSEALLSNTGGVATLIGDPPNVLIGSAAGFSFTDFLVHSLPIVLVSWAGALFLLLRLFKKELSKRPRSVKDAMRRPIF